MARSAKQRQKARQRKIARRKEKKKKKRVNLSRGSSPRSLLRASGSWPLYECLVSEEWQKAGTLVQILVARRSPLGQFAVGTFLVDLGCLGVKNAFGRILPDLEEYRQLRNTMMAHQRMIEADLNLAAKIVREAIAYAANLGFKPNPDYRDAMLVLGDADPDACDEPIPLGGEDGRPFFIAGPYDDAKRIIGKLVRKLGPDGFHYIIPLSPDEEVFEE